VCALVAVHVLALLGCGPTTTTPKQEAKPAAGERAAAGSPPTAMKVLEEMAAAYKKAPTYADSGDVTMRVKLKGSEAIEQKYDFAVTLARPNRIRLHAYQSAVVSDGKRVYATMAECPGYVLTYDAPAELTLENIYTDQMLRDSPALSPEDRRRPVPPRGAKA
jgi:outer membrane lipoprotein-sorting protein